MHWNGTNCRGMQPRNCNKAKKSVLIENSCQNPPPPVQYKGPDRAGKWNFFVVKTQAQAEIF